MEISSTSPTTPANSNVLSETSDSVEPPRKKLCMTTPAKKATVHAGILREVCAEKYTAPIVVQVLSSTPLRSGGVVWQISDGECVISCNPSKGMDNPQAVESTWFVELSTYHVCYEAQKWFLIPEKCVVLKNKAGPGLGNPKELTLEGVRKPNQEPLCFSSLVHTPSVPTSPVPNAPNNGRLSSPLPPVGKLVSTNNSKRPATVASGNKSAEQPLKLLAISELKNVYSIGWKLCATVVKKSELRPYKGNKQMFDVILRDASKKDIKLTFWDPQSVQFYPSVQIGNTYEVSHCSIQRPKPQYKVTDHEFDLSSNSTTRMTEVTKVELDLPVGTPISQIMDMKLKDLVNVIGVITDVGDLETISNRKGGNSVLRRIRIRDETMFDIEVTLWGKEAEQCTEDFAQDKGVICIEQAVVGGYKESRELSVAYKSTVRYRPPCARTDALMEWAAMNAQLPASSLTAVRVAPKNQIDWNKRHEDLQTLQSRLYYETDDTSEIHLLPATIKHIPVNKSLWKLSCLACRRPLKTDSLLCAELSCRAEGKGVGMMYFLPIELQDGDLSVFAIAFDREAQQLVKVKASDVAEWKREAQADEHNLVKADRWRKIFIDLTEKKFLFAVRIKTEDYNGKSMNKYTILGSRPFDACANDLASRETVSVQSDEGSVLASPVVNLNIVSPV